MQSLPIRLQIEEQPIIWRKIRVMNSRQSRRGYQFRRDIFFKRRSFSGSSGAAAVRLAGLASLHFHLHRRARHRSTMPWTFERRYGLVHDLCGRICRRA
jgi:hypothetical protein